MPDLVVLERLTAPYRVRFDESTPHGAVRASALVRYAQDAAWLHSEALGYDRGWYAERGLTWLVRSLELALVQPVGTGATLEVTTRVTGYRKVWARRLATIRDEMGGTVAWIHTDWVMVDARGLPRRVPEEFQERFAVTPRSFDPVRVPAETPPEMATSVGLSVRAGELDPMGHANNAVYLDYLEEVVGRLPGGPAVLRAAPRVYRGEYLMPAVPDACLVGEAWPGAPGARFRLRLAAGEELFRGVVTPGEVAEPEQP
jgi:acyl-CoA thioester hydrolase